MNGAMAELCARINSRAKTPSVIRMGVIHQRLLLQKKANNSPAIPNRCPVVFKKPIFPPQPHPTAGFFAVAAAVLDTLRHTRPAGTVAGSQDGQSIGEAVQVE